MSELSNNVGKDGEGKALYLLSIIGWAESITGIDITCRDPKKHKLPSSESGRKEHGVDLVFAYMCPFEPDTRKHILISVKNTVSEKNKPRTPSKIKQDLVDLDTALSCFKKSEIRAKQNVLGGAKRSQDIGLLVYLDMNVDYPSKRDSIIGAQQFPVDSGHVFNILDTQRFDFIEACDQYIRLDYSDWDYGFYTPVHSPAHQGNVSSVMPVSYISSGPLLYSLASNDRQGNTVKNLLIFSEDKFNEEVLPGLLSLALDVTGDWADAKILFPDYNETKHSAIAMSYIQQLPQSKQSPKVEVGSYSSRGRTR